jgi:alkylation response protein AidB-like acyl-CoA dehydrogenase
VAKACVEASARRAQQRVQFDQRLGEFELVKKKLAYVSACAFAMEAMTAECASFIDRGFEDYMLETAMLKVWSTDVLWQIVNDTMQIWGGAGFFMDQPYERWMRDARLNLVGEGANDVLRAFIAMVGIKPVADQFLKVKDALSHPWRDLGTLVSFGGSQIWSRLAAPEVPVRSVMLREAARRLGSRVRDFSQAVQKALMTHREQILFRQYVQERLADAACELYASACALARLDHLLTAGNGHADTARDVTAGRYFLRVSDRRFRQCMAALTDNDDALTTQAADAVLARYAP